VPNSILAITKITLSIIWIGFTFSFFSVFPEPYNSYLLSFGIFMAMVHLLEYLAVKIRFGHLKAINFFQTLIFGFAHWIPIIKNQR